MTDVLTLGRCRYCEKQLVQPAKGRNRVFCDEECRKGWKKEQRDVERMKRDE